MIRTGHTARAGGPPRGVTGAADVRTLASAAAVAAGLLVALLLPTVASTYYIRLVAGIFMFGTLASAWNLIGGYAGYADFGAAAFFGLGAYATGILMTAAHAPFVVGVAAGCVLAAIAAGLMGSVLLRLRGHYFAVASLGFMLVLQQLAANLGVTGGGAGMNLPVARNFTAFYYWLLGILILAVLAGYALPRSRAGYALAAIRENQDAAQVLGIEPLPYKILAYAASAWFFGAAGGVYAYWFTFIDPPTVFNVDFTIQAVVMTLFGGPGTTLGPIVGAIVLKSLDTILTSVSVFLHNVLFGGLICLLVVFAPRGLAEIAAARGSIWRAIRTGLRESRV
ncbi:MAG TPA: branched-chain amino acid ABC transporter permease [bacterium]|nr:branched-chain amino acid ABC transporter permease [bacterium]